MFEELKSIFRKPGVFEHSNSPELWSNPHISKQMLKFHLDPNVDPASRNRKFMERSIEWISGKFRIGPGTRILDLGCGPGLYAIEFARRGAKVTGIDVSQNSIDYAVERAEDEGLAIEYLNADYTACTFRGKYDLVTFIYDDYCVLNRDKRKKILRKIRSALDDKGHFVLDILTDSHFGNVRERQSCVYSQSGGFWSPNEHFVFEMTHKYDREMVILEKNTVIEQDRSFSIYNYLKCFTLDEIIRELSDNGFTVNEYYSDIAGTGYKAGSSEIALINSKT